MRTKLPFLCVFLPALGATQEPSAGDALLLEWDVRRIERDWMDRRAEVHRRERITLMPDRMRVEDLTFGGAWIVRRDAGKVWKIDEDRGRYCELTFEQVRARQGEIAGILEAAAERVAGTEDERDLRRILEGMGRYSAQPRVELRDTGEKTALLGRDCVGKEVVVDGEIHLMSVFVDPARPEGADFFRLLSDVGAFHPEVAAALDRLGGTPMRGVLRYLEFGTRVTQEVEVVRLEKTTALNGLFERLEGLERCPWQGFEEQPEPAVQRPQGNAPGETGEERR